MAGGYLSITNTGTETDRLVSARFEGSARVEIHEMKMEGDVMKMAELPDGLPIPPGATVALKPGGYHLMFMELKAPLVEHERIKGSLTFEKAGSIEVEFNVEAKGEKGGEHGAHKHDHSSLPDDKAIEAVMKAQFDKPEAPLSVGPVAVEGDFAVAGWVQHETGGRALLKRGKDGWSIHLCSGDSLKDAHVLAMAGMTHDAANALAGTLARVESAADPARIAKLALSRERSWLAARGSMAMPAMLAIPTKRRPNSGHE